ncbi:MAG: hypothetical protein JRG96_19530 [Deltaproteobacteria bacterium]|nr:hypothetical protein [Deltaproteobacteria bacterium]
MGQVKDDVKYRVIQWYTGAIACEQVRAIHRHPDLELVGAVVHHDEKVGKDVGEIAGIGPIGVPCIQDMDTALQVEADCVLYNAPYEHYDEIIPILESGKNVVSPIGPWYAEEIEDRDALIAACEKGAATVAGAGVNPGWQGDLLPLIASSACTEIDHILVREFADISGFTPFTVTEVMGFGKAIAELQENQGFLDYMVGCFKQTAAIVAAGIGRPHQEIETEVDYFAASKDCMDGRVKQGTMAGLRLGVHAVHDGRRTVKQETNWFVDPAALEHWGLPDRRHGWSIEIQGRPDVEMSIHVGGEDEGVRGTAARVINTIPMVCEAKPGILGGLDMPLPRAWRVPLTTDAVK